MKKSFRSTVAVLATSIMLSAMPLNVAADDAILINATNFGSASFADYLKDMESRFGNRDGKFTSDEVNKFLSFELDNSITKIDGISYFPNLYKLDLTNCSKLTNLNASDAPSLKEIVLGTNNSLNYITASQTPLESINLTGCPNLKRINLNNTKVQEISFNKCPNIERIYLSNTDISEIDLSACEKLERLTINGTTVKSINTAACSNLYYLNIYKTNIQKIDISNNPFLLKTCLLEEDISTNPKACVYNYSDYSNSESGLECSVTINNDTKIGVENSDKNFPDKAFQKFLNTHDLDGDNFLTVSEMLTLSSIYLKEDYGITSFEGINFFPNLVYLHANDNNIKSIDLSENPNLVYLSLNNTGITNINLSNNSELKHLFLKNNGITELDLSNNHNLIYLYLDNNPKVTFTLGNVDNISISLSNCELTELNLGTKNIESLTIPYNNLTELDLSNQSQLNDLYCNNNKLSTLSLSNCESLERLDCTNNNLSSLDLSGTKLAEKVEYIPSDSTNPKYYEFNKATSSNYYRLEVDSNVNIYGLKCDVPDPIPTPEPTSTATPTPSTIPTVKPTTTPVATPTSAPTKAPTTKPTAKPTKAPTVVPTVEPSKVPTATPTTKPTNAPTAVPSAAPTTTPTTEPTKAPSVEDFAERLYTTCLGREAEEAGKDYWVSELKAGKPGSEVAEGFFFSPEYEGRKLNNKDFIGTLYETFMGRTPADDEVAYWNSEMDNGKTRKDIFDGFVNSPEWANICLTYGIRSGGLAAPTFEKEASDAVKAFAERLYTTCLGREAEKEGLEWWAAELANLRQTGTVAASGFFNSPEFIGLKTDDNEYVTRLYKTFMGRDPEEAGFEFWTSELKAGKDRQYVFDGFSVAPEFANLCAEAGIMR